MNAEELKSLGQDCYAAFNVLIPGWNSPAWKIWAEMCANVPLEAVPWIRSKIVELDSIPRNFGKAVRGYWRDWRHESGQPRETLRCCPECDRQTPGFFTVWRRDGCRVLMRCYCNAAEEYANMPRVTRAMAGNIVYNQAAGLRYLVAPAGERFLDFEKRMFPVSGQVADPDAAGKEFSRLARNPVGPEPIRSAHAEHLALCDAPF
jgi:hypothetical protein